MLATVATGLYVGRYLMGVLRPAERVQALAFWDGTRFILEGLAFILIGMQLRQVVADMSDVPTTDLLRDCGLVCVVVVVVRIAWMFAWHGVPYFLGLRSPTTMVNQPLRHAVLIGWAGMRGVDSLAAALAVPFVIADGTTPFPQRNMILLASFSVILTTLVLQGLTLPYLIRWLGFSTDDGAAREEAQIRLSVAEAAVQRVEEMAANVGTSPEVAAHLRELYQFRIQHYRAGLEPNTNELPGSSLDAVHRLLLELLKAERQVVLTMWDEGLITDDARMRIERELDYEELRFGD